MSKKKLRAICLLIVIIPTISAIIWKAAGQIKYLEQIGVVTSRFTMPGGTVYDLRDDEGDTVWLRKISPDGSLTQHLKLDKISADDQGSGQYVFWRIIGHRDDQILLSATYMDIYEYFVEYESVISVDSDGSTQELFSTEGDSNIGVSDLGGYGMYSPQIFDGMLYYGRGEEHGFTIYEIGLDDGIVNLFAVIDVPHLFRFYVSEKREILTVDMDSHVTIRNADGGNERVLFSPGEASSVSDFGVTEKGEPYIVALNVSYVYMLDMDTDSGQLRQMMLPENAISVSMSSKDVWAGHNQRYEMLHSSNAEAIVKLSPSLKLLLDKDIILIAATVLAITALVALTLYNTVGRQSVPLILKQIVIAIPVFLIGLFIILNKTLAIMEKQMQDQICNTVLWKAHDKAAEMDFSVLEIIDWDSPHDNEEYVKICENIQSSSRGREIKYRHSASNNFEEVSSYVTADETQFISYALLSVRNGFVYTASMPSLPHTLPYKQIQLKEQSTLMKQVLDTKSTAYGPLYDIGGEGVWGVALYPIFNDSGEIYAILEACIPAVQVEYTLGQTRVSLRLWLTLFMMIIMFVYFSVLYFALRRLGKLKRATAALTEGNYHYRLGVRGHDEIAKISGSFNIMAEQVETSVENITKTSGSYSRFVPRAMFDLLEKETVLEVNLGDSRLIDCSILCFYSDSFEACGRDNLFEYLKAFYSAVMPTLSASEGLIERYSEDEVIALFRKNPATVVGVAGELFRTLTSSMDNVSGTAVIGYSQINLGVIGHDDRLSVTAVTLFINDAKRVAELGSRLGCRVLITEEAFEECRGRELGLHRFIGTVSFDKEQIPLYEMFEADSEEIRTAKKATLGIFNQALDLYNKGEFYRARNLFIDVIKRSPQDLVAREYLLLSDKLMDTGSEPVQLTVN